MADAKLKVDGREVSLSADITTIGRTPDNDISFPDDANVSRHHAEIEFRGGEYCLIELGSSNGTTVNGGNVTSERYLSSGDVILFGGSAKIEFLFGEPAPKKDESPAPEAVSADVPSESLPDANLPDAPGAPGIAVPDVQAAAASGGSNVILLVAGIVACVAILFVGIAAAVFFLSGSSSGSSSGSGSGSSGGSKPWFGGIFGGSTCEAKASITKPETGDTIAAATDIELDVQEGDCVAKAVFSVDGIEFASAEAPFNASIDPKEFPEFSDGVD